MAYTPYVDVKRRVIKMPNYVGDNTSRTIAPEQGSVYDIPQPVSIPTIPVVSKPVTQTSGTFVNRPTRNNNPLNIKVPSAGLEEARKRYKDPNITIDPVPATDKGYFLKFSSPQKGYEAASILLDLGYKSYDVDAALRRWSGGGYGSEIVPDLKGKKIGELNPQERLYLVTKMAKREGYKPSGDLPLSEYKPDEEVGAQPKTGKFSNFAERVNEARTKGKTDTDILESLKEKVPELTSVIDQIRERYETDAQIKNDRDLVNFMAQKYSKKMPTVESVPLKEEPQAQPTITEKLGEVSPTIKAAESLGKGQDFLLDKGSQAMNWAYGLFKNAPIVKEASEIGGSIVGGLGYLVSRPINDVLYGIKGLKEGKVYDTHKESLKTAQVGYEVGKEAVPLFIASELGGAPFSAAFTVTMLHDGSKQLQTGIKQEDPVKIVEGILSLVSSGLGVRSMLRGEKLASQKPTGEKGKVKTVPEPPSDGTGGGGIRAKIIKQESAGIYRDLLKPTKSEVEKIEIRQGRDLNEYYGFMADQGLIIESQKVNGRPVLDTTKARETLTGRYESANKSFEKMLDRYPEKKYDLEKLRVQSKIDLVKRNQNLSALEIQNRKSAIDELIDAEIERHGQVVNAPTLNQIKRGMWSGVSFDSTKPYKTSVAYSIGNRSREWLERGIPDENVKALNQTLGKYAASLRLLKNSHGRVVAGGLMSKYLSGLTGAVIGTTTHVPIIGSLLGKYIGENIAEWMTKPERITGKVQKKLQGSEPQPVIENVPEKVPVKTQKQSSVENPVVDYFRSIGVLQRAKQLGGEINPTRKQLKLFRGVGDSRNKKFSLDYYTETPERALDYAGEYIEKTIIPKKIADFTKPSKELKDILYNNIDELNKKQIDNLLSSEPKLGIKGEKNFFVLIENKKLQKALQDNGYDVVKYKDISNQFVVHNTIATLPNYIEKIPDAEIKTAMQQQYVAAKEVKQEFETLLEKLGKENKAQVRQAPLKNIDRSVEKAIKDYDGDVTKVTDIVRGALIKRTVQQSEETFKSVVGAMGDAIYGKPKSIPIGNTTLSHQVKVRLSNGHIAEIQITTPNVFKVQFSHMRGYYDKVRALSDKIKNGTLTKSEYQEFQRRQRIMESMLKDALKKDSM